MVLLPIYNIPVFQKKKTHLNDMSWTLYIIYNIMIERFKIYEISKSIFILSHSINAHYMAYGKLIIYV